MLYLIKHVYRNHSLILYNILLSTFPFMYKEKEKVERKISSLYKPLMLFPLFHSHHSLIYLWWWSHYSQPHHQKTMATQYYSFFFFVFIFIFLTMLLPSLSTQQQEQDMDSFVRPLDRKLLGLNRKEKLSHFKFYWHDIQSGKNPSSVAVVLPPMSKLNTTTGFGLVNMIDNPLTLGPELSSKLVGRSQGFYASACQTEVDLLMAMNFAFIEGKYNGSTITILGRNPVFNKVREMPVIGGSGLFRFARGYAEARTHWFDLKTGDAIVEYNVYVFHY